MKNLKDILEQWRPKPGVTPVEVDVDSSTTSDEPTTAIDRVTDVLTGGGEDSDGDSSGIDLSFLGGSGSSGPKWEFNRNPTGQMRTDRDAARLDADGYTKGNIYVYKLRWKKMTQVNGVG
jgi:hypothetical protein